MKSVLKKLLKPFIPQAMLDQRRAQQQKKELVAFHQKQFADWNQAGCPAPPPHIVKQMTIGDYQKKYGHQVLVETGTYLGDMVEAQKEKFKKIFSIELGTDLFEQAKQRFKQDKNVVIMQGDSGKVLPKIMSTLTEPAIFWLDGHYSAGITAQGDKDCPIFEELDSVLAGKKLNHVILIDDARCFVGEGDYPTIEKLAEYVKGKNDSYKLEVKNDVIRFAI